MKTRKNKNKKSVYKIEPSKEKTPVNITSLKEFVERCLPPGTPLREVILVDDEEISRDEFVTKLMVWLRLSRLKRR